MPRSPRCNVALFMGRHASPYSGLSTYSAELFRGLIEQSEGSNFCFWAFFDAPPPFEDELRAVADLFPARARICPLNGGVGRRFASFFDTFRSLRGFDLVHGTSNVLPLRGNTPGMLTLHDILQAYPSPLAAQPNGGMKPLLHRSRTQYYRFLFSRQLRSCSLVVTDREPTKLEILNRFPSHPRIEVLFPPLKKIYEQGDLDQDRHGFVAFASRDKRKGIGDLLPYFRDNQQEKLQIIVGDSAALPEIKREWGELKNVRIITGLSDGELRSLYARSEALLFPSRAEGFGYPIYEALSQGTAVFCYPHALESELLEISTVLVRPIEDWSPGALDTTRSSLQSVTHESRSAVSARIRTALSSEEYARRMLALYEGFCERASLSTLRELR